MSRRIVVAIDGPAGSGKSTVARRIAEKLGFLYIDSGAMYRAVALYAIRNGTALDDMAHLAQLAEAAEIGLGEGRVTLNSEDVTADIRAPEVSAAASKVAAVAPVRRALVAKQRRYSDEASVVMEGRDIGTVVFPDAQVKIFLDASPEVRARRRAEDNGEDSAILEERDRRDRSRADSPLVQAADAVYLSTDGLTLGQVEEEVLKLVRARTSNGKEIVR